MTREELEAHIEKNEAIAAEVIAAAKSWCGYASVDDPEGACITIDGDEVKITSTVGWSEYPETDSVPLEYFALSVDERVEFIEERERRRVRDQQARAEASERQKAAAERTMYERLKAKFG